MRYVIKTNPTAPTAERPKFCVFGGFHLFGGFGGVGVFFFFNL